MTKYQLKILKGTILKVQGHPVQVKKSFYIPMPENFLDDSQSTVLFADDDPTNIKPLVTKDECPIHRHD